MALVVETTMHLLRSPRVKDMVTVMVTVMDRDLDTTSAHLPPVELGAARKVATKTISSSGLTLAAVLAEDLLHREAMNVNEVGRRLRSPLLMSLLLL